MAFPFTLVLVVYDAELAEGTNLLSAATFLGDRLPGALHGIVTQVLIFLTLPLSY